MDVVLSPLGHRLVLVDSGEAALRAVLERDFAVILLDVMMPRLGGFETAELIRKRERSATTPIIFLTASGRDEANVMKGYGLGAADYLVKPVDPDMLRAKVAVFVELHRARLEVEQQASALLAVRTERARAESVAAGYRQLAEAIPQQVWTATPEGTIDYLNRVVLRYFDEPLASILATGWLPRLHPDDRERCHERWTSALRTGEPYEVELRLRRHDGEYHWHLCRATPERDERGRITRWFGTNTDIEDRKRVEQQLSATVQSRDDLIAIVSHDLRGPLGAIALAAEIVDPHHPERIPRTREVIKRSVAHMETLLRDLLDLAKLESGKLSFDPAPVEVGELVAEALTLIEPIASAKVLRLASQLAVPSTQIHGDRDRLLQVFQNLLGNAIKFSPPDGQISVSADLHADDHVAFAVRNDGPGIGSEELPFVFDRFWQAKKTAKAGTGLGLAICKGIVQQHGGAIWVESQPGAGTTFFFTMPVVRDLLG